ncbi:MAG: DUF1592 domain-containing protein, partial [Myxococcota bacterium]
MTEDPNDVRAIRNLGPGRSLVPVALCFAILACDNVVNNAQVDFDTAVNPEEPVDTIADTACDADRLSVESGRWRRLTREQFSNSIRDLLGVDADVSGFLKDTTLNESPFPANVSIPPQDIDVENYYRVAEDVSERFDVSALVSCELASSECPRQFITDFGRRVFRRPLVESEVDALLRVYVAGAQAIDSEGVLVHSPEAGVRLTVHAMLQSPSFLYIAEFGSDDGEVVPLTSYEIATRLSFLLWRSTPDLELLEAAELGALDSVEGIVSAAERMMSDPRFTRTLVLFMKTMSGIDHVKDATRNDIELTPVLKDAMELEAERFLSQVFETDGSIRSLFTAPSSYPDDSLEVIYGVGGNGSRNEGFPERRGILTNPAFLVASQPLETFFVPTYRGGEIRKLLMCQPIPAPVIDIEFEDVGEVSNRERLRLHKDNSTCASCHELMDPLGFALEGFDDLGRFRTEDAEGPI